MEVTLNKDGKPRKIGSGKTKGAGCFAKIKWKQLREFIREDDDILVSRVWLRTTGALIDRRKKTSSKKQTAPLAPVPSPVPIPAKKSIAAEKIVSKTHAQSVAPLPAEVDEYEPPPLFANLGEIKKY